jgi:hypothetical protein
MRLTEESEEKRENPAFYPTLSGCCISALATISDRG